MRKLVAPLVGRGAELGRIADALGADDVVGVVLVGPAGVGKTRLATESLAIAEQIGFTTARITATRAGSSVPTGALAPLLGPDGTFDPTDADALLRARHSVAARSGGHPFMILVDDAHALDGPSAMVVHQLAVAGDAFVVVTVRAGEPCHDPVSALWKDELAVRIDLGPLAREDTEGMVRELLGGIVDGSTSRAIWERSAGNPLFVRELVIGAVDSDHLRCVDGVWRFSVPFRPSRRLDELIGERLVGLSPDVLAAFELVVVGEPLPVQVLSELCGPATVDLLDAKGLIAVTRTEHGLQVRAAHPLLADVQRDRMGPLRVRTASRKLFDTTAPTEQRRWNDPIRRAVWALDGEAEVDPAELSTAAMRARAAHDVELATRLLQAAVDRGSTDPDTLQALGELLTLQGRHDPAQAVLGAAGHHAEDDSQRALVALTQAELFFWGMDRADDAVVVLTGAAKEIEDPEWIDSLAGQRASYDLLCGSPRDALALVEPILERSGGRGFVEAAITAAPTLAMLGRSGEAVAVADTGFAEHICVGEQPMLGHAGIHLVSRCLALIEAGQLTQAGAEARAGYDAAVEGSVVEGRAWFALMLGRAWWLRRPVDAEEWFRLGDAAFAEIGYDGPRRWCLAGAALCAATRGEVALARELSRAEQSIGSRSVQMMRSDVLRSRAWVAWADRDPGWADQLLRTAAETAKASGSASLEVAALHDRVRLGDPATVVDRLAELAGTVDGELARVRAAHAAALADADTDGLSTVTDAFAELGAVVLAAEAAGQAAAALRRSGSSRPAERMAQRRRSLAEVSGGLATPAMAIGGEASSLTRRELEIARLAAAQKPNREIAEVLVVSVRTVENHLYRVYEKLGIKGRDALADALDP